MWKNAYPDHPFPKYKKQASRSGISTPDLAVGKRYFVFVKDDGAFHANPFPGGCNAVIEI